MKEFGHQLLDSAKSDNQSFDTGRSMNMKELVHQFDSERVGYHYLALKAREYKLHKKASPPASGLWNS
jgi:hypothetical protein